MLASRQLWFLQRNWQPLQSIIPAVAGCIMIGASFAPWLKDPLGKTYSAWRLPIDIGWQFRTNILNYGVLCLCCAIFALLVAYANWRPFKGSNYFVHKHIAAGLLCIVPVLLFLLQYLWANVDGMAQLGQHTIQILLVQEHFGYTTPEQFIPISPFTLDTSTLQGRFELLVDQIVPGLLLPCLSTWILIDYRRLFKILPSRTTSKRNHKWIWFSGIVLLVVVLGRAPAGIICEYEAKALLSSGSYRPALMWLDAARFFNPALDQVAYYHEERGQAVYYLYPSQQSDDSRVYLASAYREQGDYLDAYQEALAVWQAHRTTSWAIDEMSVTLERLGEFTRALKGQPTRRPLNDSTALPWLESLVEVDATNVYGQYLAGRIQYDLHNYTACTTQMLKVIQLSSDPDVESSAYTYMALSDAGQGDYSDERTLLFKAVSLDPGYLNNTARQELSGLR